MKRFLILLAFALAVVVHGDSEEQQEVVIEEQFLEEQKNEQLDQIELLGKQNLALNEELVQLRKEVQNVDQLRQDLEAERLRNQELTSELQQVKSSLVNLQNQDETTALRDALKNMTGENVAVMTKDELEGLKQQLHSSYVKVNTTLDAIYEEEARARTATARLLLRMFFGAIGTLLAGVVALAVLIHFHAEKVFNMEKVKALPEYSYIVPNSEAPGRGPIHRSIAAKEGIRGVLKTGSVRTMHELFLNGCKLSKDQPCLGKRTIVDGKAGPFVFQSYKEIQSRITNFGSGFTHQNLLPVTDNMKLLGIYAKNRVEWLLAEYASYAYSVATVPLYDSLGPDSAKYIINQTSLACVVAGGESEVKTLLKIKPECKSLKAIITMDKVSEELAQAASKVSITLYTFEQMEEIGKQNPKPHKPAKADDVATFCYTSGTTGDAKGVILTHANFISNLGVIEALGVIVNNDDRYLSYLPLAHVFERVVVSCLLHQGARIGFFQGDTRKLMEDISVLKPTIFGSVPRLFSRIHDKVLEKVDASGFITSKIFRFALESKKEYMKKGYASHPLWDKLIFHKLAAKSGLNHCRYMISGSAPLAPYVMEFMRAVFPCRIVEGYGQTETCAVSCVGHPEDLTIGHIGGPSVSNEVALFDVPEMSYLSTDRVHGEQQIPCNGRGEICIRGHNVFKGYYKMPEKTAETIDKDGWNHTGDIGIWLPSGQLRIVDRKKNIFKLAQGEYVAAEKIENIYLASLFLEQIFVYGDSFQYYLVGIFVPDKEYVTKWAKDNNITGSWEELCENKQVYDAIMKDLDRLATQAKLGGYEKVKKAYLSPLPFSEENGLVTPTFKVKRNETKKFFQKEIDRMYAQ